MAIYEPGAGLDPFRGLDLGTVFQRGKYAPVIKSGSKTQGQRLAPFQDQKAAWYRALQLWKELLPFEKANWDAARPDFPTTDRFGNTVLSSARDLFLRTIARLPIEDQKPLNTPRAAYTGTTPADPDLQLNSGALEFTVPAVPAGEQFGYSLFMTIQRPLSTDYAKTSYRRIAFDDDYSAGATIDVTAQYEALFGAIQSDVRIFWCAEIVNTDTPEVLSSACGSVNNAPTPDLPIPVGFGLYAPNSGERANTPFGEGVPYDPFTPFTVQIIIRNFGPGTNGDSYGNAFYYTGISGPGSWQGTTIYVRNDRRVRVAVILNTGIPIVVDTVGAITNNQIMHIAYTYSAVNRNWTDFKFYFNGVLQSTSGFGSTSRLPTVNGQARILQNAPTGSFQRRPDGVLYDALFIQDAELPLSDIQQLNSGVLPGQYVSNLIRHYTFDEVSGNICPEDINGFDADMTGFGTRSNLGGGAWRNAAGGIAP